MRNCQIIIILFLNSFSILVNPNYQNVLASDEDTNNNPRLYDPNLTVQEISGGLDRPTAMALLDSNDILITEKNNGTVRRVINGELTKEPLLDLHVANDRTRGLLGIDVATNSTIGKTFVFLYYTESSTETDNRYDSDPLGNRLSRFELADNTLTNSHVLADLPASPGPGQNGGVVKIGPDNNVYVTVGDLMTNWTLATNNKSGTQPDGTAGILRITQDGNPVKSSGNNEGLLGNSYPLNMYYAYGIRNSFGMDFDPVTGNLWDTENGPEYGDEINLVEPGFNSGYYSLTGKSKNNFNSDELVDFGGKGKYSEPEFSWGTEEQKFTVAPTSIRFLNSSGLGEEYEYDVFVGTISGEIYHFDLDAGRNDLELHGSLADKVAEDIDDEEIESLILGKGFGVISDIEVGQDGSLYVLSHTKGSVYRIFQGM